MDCCNYGEYRAGGQYGAGAGWEGYGLYAPLPYAPYAHAYYPPHAHDPYQRYYRYDYPAHHAHHNDHVMPMDYGGYGSKEARVRRALVRRDARAHTPGPQLPIPSTPPLECGMNGRSPAYYEPQMWSHYQMGAMSAGWGSGAHGGWMHRGAWAREHMRYTSDCRPAKGFHTHNQALSLSGNSTPYPMFEDSNYSNESVSRQSFSSSRIPPAESVRTPRDCAVSEPRRSPPKEKPVPIVPLPAFQQAFGSTEIGKFAEAFSRAEIALEDTFSDNFGYESFSDWDGPEAQWSSQPTVREIKCEENY